MANDTSIKNQEATGLGSIGVKGMTQNGEESRNIELYCAFFPPLISFWCYFQALEESNRPTDTANTVRVVLYRRVDHFLKGLVKKSDSFFT